MKNTCQKKLGDRIGKEKVFWLKSVWKSPKNISILAFFANFCPIKIDLSGKFFLKITQQCLNYFFDFAFSIFFFVKMTCLVTLFDRKTAKMSHFQFSILAFSTIYSFIKIDLSGNTVWPQASNFKNSPKLNIFGIFNTLWATQNINVARFARNIEWHFFVIFKHREWGK